MLDVYYARARMYDAADRRFMAVDPVKSTIVLPMTLVQYTYVLNNPVLYTDPYGLFALSKNSPHTDMVTILQEYLSILGYLHMNPGDVPGKFGDKTSEAVALFGVDKNGRAISTVDLLDMLQIVNAGINRKYNLEWLSKPGGPSQGEKDSIIAFARAEYDAVAAQIRNFMTGTLNEVVAYFLRFDPCFWSGKPSWSMSRDRARIERGNMREMKSRYGRLIEYLAADLGCSPGLLAGIIYAESSLVGFQDGQVLIRFEVHVFSAQIAGIGFERSGNEYVSTNFKYSASRGDRGHQFRASRTRAWQEVHTSQASEREALAVAISINRTAAYNSISYGFGQIMGYNHSLAGFNSAEEMLGAMSTGQTAQINAIYQLISNNNSTSGTGMTMRQALQAGNLSAFVRIYNGKLVGTPENQEYVQKILAGKDAYERNATSIG